MPESFYGTLAGLAAAAGSGVLAPTSVVTLYGAAKLPITFNYSLGIQRQLGHTMMVDLAYVGSQSRRLLWQRNINPVPMGADHVNEFPQNRDPTIKSLALPPNFLRPYQGYGDNFAYEFGSSSNYNSLQLLLNRRFSRGLRTGFSYTFSKVLGTADQDAARESPFFAPRSRNYNTFNHTQFSSLYTTATFNPAAKQIDPLFLTPSAARRSRKIQLALRNW